MQRTESCQEGGSPGEVIHRAHMRAYESGEGGCFLHATNGALSAAVIGYQPVEHLVLEGEDARGAVRAESLRKPLLVLDLLGKEERPLVWETSGLGDEDPSARGDFP